VGECSRSRWGTCAQHNHCPQVISMTTRGCTHHHKHTCGHIHRGERQRLTAFQRTHCGLSQSQCMHTHVLTCLLSRWLCDVHRWLTDSVSDLRKRVVCCRVVSCESAHKNTFARSFGRRISAAQHARTNEHTLRDSKYKCTILVDPPFCMNLMFCRLARTRLGALLQKALLLVGCSGSPRSQANQRIHASFSDLSEQSWNKARRKAWKKRKIPFCEKKR
jgi:hypothetical protein